MHKTPKRTGFQSKSAAALNQHEFRAALATNCFVLAILLFEVGFGFLSASLGWFLLPAALAGAAIWLGPRGMRVVAGMLLAASLIVGSFGLYHHLGEHPHQHPVDLFWAR